jgi:hypothetical protein
LDGSLPADEVAHLVDRFVLPSYVARPDLGAALKSFCSFDAPCVENVNCASSSAVNDARDAVAHIQFRSGGFIYICSGGLLTDTDSSSQIPYFLTANHCISKGREASSMEASFFFDTPGNGSCYNPDGAVPSTVGASIRSTSRTSDYTLMELSQAPPSGAVFLGWSSASVAKEDTALVLLLRRYGTTIDQSWKVPLSKPSRNTSAVRKTRPTISPWSKTPPPGSSKRAATRRSACPL